MNFLLVVACCSLLFPFHCYTQANDSTDFDASDRHERDWEERDFNDTGAVYFMDDVVAPITDDIIVEMDDTDDETLDIDDIDDGNLDIDDTNDDFTEAPLVNDDDGEFIENDTCDLNADGELGNLNGTPILIQYNYEILTMAEIFDESMMKSIEAAVGDAIVQSSIPSCRVRKLKMSLNYERQRRLIALNGISSSPSDVKLDSNCEQIGNTDGQECNVVKGGLTVYFEGGEDKASQINGEIFETIKKSSDLLENDDDILDIIFFQESVKEPSQQTPPETPPFVNNETRANGNVRTPVFVGMGFGAFVIAGFLTGKRIRTRRNRSMSGSESDSENLNETDNQIENADEIDEELFLSQNMNESSLDQANQSGLHSLLNSSGSVTVSSSFAT